MKAKEYARKWGESDKSKKALTEIFHGFLDDMKALMDSRGGKNKSNETLASCIREINTKWESFALQSEDIHPDGFRMLLFPEMPDGRMIHEMAFPEKPFPEIPKAQTA